MQHNERFDDTSNNPVRRKSILKNNYLSMNETEKKKTGEKIDIEQITDLKLIEKKEKVETNIYLSNRWDYNRLKEILDLVFEHDGYFASISSLVIYCIFADDIRFGFLSISWDMFIDISLLIIMIIFGIEFILSCTFKTNYLLTFYCYIDLLSLLSIVMDIQLLLNPFNDFHWYRYKKLLNKSKLSKNRQQYRFN